MKKASVCVVPSAEAPVSFKGYRFPPDIISYTVWLYDRFPLSLRMVEEMLAARGIELTYETVRCWATKFGLAIAKQIRSTAPGRGDKWHLDEVVVTINGTKHWLWRAVDQHGDGQVAQLYGGQQRTNLTVSINQHWKLNKTDIAGAGARCRQRYASAAW